MGERNKLYLPQVTLLGVDTSDAESLLKAFNICKAYADFGAKKLITRKGAHLPRSDIQTIYVDQISSTEDYSHFMIKSVSDFVGTPYVLVIQHDGFILNPGAWTDEFLDYDYIGAPWWYEDDYNVGNGGFSLRSKKLLNFLQSDRNIVEHHPEDHHICRTYGPYLKSKGFKFAPESLAARFSIEGALLPPAQPVKFGSVWTDEFGFHGLKKTDISNWDGYPDFVSDL